MKWMGGDTTVKWISREKVFSNGVITLALLRNVTQTQNYIYRLFVPEILLRMGDKCANGFE